MRDIRFLLKPHYAASRALIIGIDRYKKASPLRFAVSDAKGVRDALIEKLGFLPENIVALFDEDATHQNVRHAFLNFATDSVALDDRIVIFFAGHGTTRSGARGEVGYLVPVDADPGVLSTLIRWDELTANSDLIKAKHILFIMDACYGGLALTRSLEAGSTRFLKDMLLRYSRQVLTAGKADEQVADSGGPIPGHSVFTGHFLEAISGKAATPDGIITANGVMSYVYGKVAHDKNSRQTPHYGYFDGDGDFILAAPQLTALAASAEKDIDELVIIPYIEEDESPSTLLSKIRRIKELLSSENGAIQLHDFIIEEVKRFLSLSGEDHFKAQGPFSNTELQLRIVHYQDISVDLSILLACVAHWGRPNHRQILKKALARATDRLGLESGLTAWIALRRYPMILQFYYAGIAAVEGQRYDSLADLFLAPVESDRRQEQRHAVEVLSSAVLELTQIDLFKRLPGHERHYTPMSEYLFKSLQPNLDDVFFIGKNFENVFDEFEVLFALVSADLEHERDERPWGPIGRFGWKGRRSGQSPLANLTTKALAMGKDWPPIENGFFGGRIERFKVVAEKYQAMVSGLNWY